MFQAVGKAHTIYQRLARAGVFLSGWSIVKEKIRETGSRSYKMLQATVIEFHSQ